MHYPKDLQLRLAPIGRLRTGYSKPTGRTGKGGRPISQPVKLDTFRFTSPSRYAIESASDAYGGEVQPWVLGNRKEWEVYTTVSELMVSIPTGQDAISINYEWWSGGECLHRCDSQNDTKTRRPCVCPADSLERSRLSKLNPPQACGLKTRLSLILPDLIDVGTWRLDTGGFYAAGDLLSKATIMEAFRDHAGIMLPARIWLHQQSDVKDGQTRRWVEPRIELLESLRSYATGQLTAGRPLAAQLPPAAGEPRRAITGGSTVTPAPAAATVVQEPRDTAPDLTAQKIADQALQCTVRSQVTSLIAIVKRDAADGGRLATDDVWVPETTDRDDPDRDEDTPQVEMTLKDALTIRWNTVHDDTEGQ